MQEKETLYNFCKSYIGDRLIRIQKRIMEVQESLTSETKSSAGDKHETGRAMLQLEREKLGTQLAEAEKMNQLLSKVTIDTTNTMVGLGSYVKTSKSNYFIAISAGEYKKENVSVYCISPNTPIGKLLLGKTIGNQVVFNKENIKILEID